MRSLDFSPSKLGRVLIVLASHDMLNPVTKPSVEFHLIVPMKGRKTNFICCLQKEHLMHASKTSSHLASLRLFQEVKNANLRRKLVQHML